MADTKPGMDVGYVAKLARIELSETEKVLFQGQLNQVLKYVEQLSEPDVSAVEPTAHAIPVYNVFRADEQGCSLDRAAVLKNAPASREFQILVPKIMD